MRQIIFLLLLTISAFSHSQEINSQIDSFMDTQMREMNIPGVAYSVIRNNQIDHIAAIGKANIEFDANFETTTRVNIASISKEITSVAVMVLAEQGEISLTDPIGLYLSNLPEQWNAVSIEQLLSHISGIPDLIIDTFTFETIGTDAALIIEELSHRDMDFQTASQWRYNQTNYLLISMLIEQVSGQSYVDFVQENVFAPAGIEDAIFADDRAIIHGRSNIYTHLEKVDGEIVPMDHLEVVHYVVQENLYSAGGLNISVVDLSRWFIALLNGEIISKTSLERLWVPPNLISGIPFERPPGRPSLWTQSALGWYLFYPGGEMAVGGSGGARSALFIYPESDLAVIVLTNKMGIQPEGLVHGIANFYLK